MEEMNAKQAERERGFTILGVLIAVLIMGTMAAVAVPKFSGAMAAANTSRIQADLAAIDTAIALYSIDKGVEPTALNQLGDYLENSGKIKPPTGKCNIDGKIEAVPGTEYSISDDKEGAGMQAHLGKYTIYDFGTKSDSKTEGQN